MAQMAHTRWRLKITFGRDLAGLIDSYFQPVNHLGKSIGLAGNWELAIGLTKLYEIDRAIAGACKGGYDALVDKLLTQGGNLLNAVYYTARRGNAFHLSSLIDRCTSSDWKRCTLLGAC